MPAPLDGLLVLDFSQFLAGPYASLKLLDMGARVIKVENPAGGDLCRKHYASDTEIDGDSTIFHAINRGKESIALDLKDESDKARARKLIEKADIMIQNFRPGVMDRLGLGYDAAKEIKPDIIYGSISGYGPAGAWSHLPGQDLLAQARSGIMWLNGNAGDGPVPIGLPIADISAGANLAHGLLGALFQRATKGVGALVETSLLEALIDLQFEFLTTYLNNDQMPPKRLQKGSAHGYLAAPYGIYQTSDGYLVLAMTSLERLADALDLASLRPFAKERGAAFSRRDEIFELVQSRLRFETASHWEDFLTDREIWSAKVSDWPSFFGSDAFSKLDMVSKSRSGDGTSYSTVRSAVRINGKHGWADKEGPKLNGNDREIRNEFDL